AGIDRAGRDAGQDLVGEKLHASRSLNCEFGLNWNDVEGRPLPQGEVAPTARVRRNGRSSEPLPLTRIASQSDLSPMGRSEESARSGRYHHSTSVSQIRFANVF